MTGLFCRFQRDNRPLSSYLHQTITNRAVGEVAGLALEELRSGEHAVSRVVDSYRFAGPTLDAYELAGRRSGAWRPRYRPGLSQETVRQYVRFAVDGALEVLEWWPDHDGDPLELPAVDEALPGVEDWDDERARYDQRLAAERWSIVTAASPQGTLGLYTFLEFTRDELEGMPAGARDLSGEIAALRGEIEPIVSALAEQVRRYFDQELPDHLRVALTRRLAELEGWQAVETSLGFPPKWKSAPPAVTNKPISSDAAGPATTESDAGATRSQTSAEELVALPGETPSRLDDASFADLMRTTRIWADAVERHPTAYRALIEDRISDLLVAALNAALPGAYREVFSRGGKTDVFVRAQALPKGTSPAKVFIGECKKIVPKSGPAPAETGLDQLLGYLGSHSLAAMLVLLIENPDVEAARRGVLERLVGHRDHLSTEPETVEGWPVLRFHSRDRMVRVCVATIDLSEPPLHPGSRRRRSEQPAD